MGLTLADIARRAGVSPITASRALARADRVAAGTRQRVLDAAAELGYAPNLLARGLVQNRTAIVGAVVLELANPFFSPMLSAIQTAAAERGFLVVVGESGRDEDTEARYVAQFQQLRVGGMIVTPVSPAMAHLERARARGTPVVVMARRWDAGDYVTADNVAGGRLVGEHLLRRGHRRIGLVAVNEPANTAARSRILGLQRALAEASVSVPPAWDLRIEGNLIEHGIEAADRLLVLAERPTAVFVTTDRMAMGFVSGLRARGVEVPREIAVVGYDDIPYAACNEVPLTSVAIPMRRLGELAATILFDRLEGRETVGGEPDMPRQILLAPELVVRASCP